MGFLCIAEPKEISRIPYPVAWGEERHVAMLASEKIVVMELAFGTSRPRTALAELPPNGRQSTSLTLKAPANLIR